MALPKKYLKKYKQTIDVMLQLRMTEEQILHKLIEQDELNGWEPITFRQLAQLSENELKELKSYCWHDGKPRCQTIGIYNLKIKEFFDETHWDITFSDDNGDPKIFCTDLDQKINNVGDGTWNYGLYKKST
jgi:hypothetical protein